MQNKDITAHIIIPLLTIKKNKKVINYAKLLLFLEIPSKVTNFLFFRYLSVRKHQKPLKSPYAGKNLL
jgi:hypothetical protein